MTTTRLDSGSTEGGAAKPIWFLAVVGHTDPSCVGRRAPLTAAEPMTLGRELLAFGAGAFDDDRISRHHAQVDVDVDDAATLTDLGSRNGTLVNEARVEKAKLRDGDVIRLGTVVLVACREPAFFEQASDPDIVGKSFEHAQMLARLGELAVLPNTVVVEGETGTGKRLVAHALHRESGRKGPLITIYCSAMADPSLPNELYGHCAGAFEGATADHVGLLEAADAGTVLLDGVDEASPELQRLFLAFLDDRSVRPIGASEAVAIDVRLVATCRRPLGEAVADGAVRRDFADRLGKLTLRVPALRDRRLDIGPLLHLFVERFAGEPVALHHRLVAALAMHDWPGNIRELERVIEMAVIDSGGKNRIRLSGELARLLSVAPIDSADRTNLEPTPAGVLVIAKDGMWFEPPGKSTVDLSSRPTLGRLLVALADKHRDPEDTGLTVPQLLEIGWPGERVIERAGANRVYVALTALRKLGLRDWIARTRHGYQIAPEVRLVMRG